MAEGEIYCQLAIDIDKELHDRSPTLGGHSIFKVPKRLCEGTDNAHVPNVLAIGPYHRHRKHLKKMEEHKKWYFKKLLERRGKKEEELPKYVEAMKKLEKDARKCYEDPFKDIHPDEFVKMMLYDGFFIIELLRRYMRVVRIDPGDSLISLGWINKKLVLDLLLVENQLPFFVVETLFKLTRIDDVEKPTLFTMIVNLFASSILPKPSSKIFDAPDCTGAKHLLSLIHDKWFYSSAPQESEERRNLEMGASKNTCHRWSNYFFVSCFPDIWKCNSLKSQGSGRSRNSNDFENSAKGEKYCKYISCATDLIEAGIEFKKVQTDSLFDINFRNGVLEIPRLDITDETGPIFWNLMVYEQFLPQDQEKIIGNYIKFMDCLINSPKDVELLCKCNILHISLGDHRVVAHIFNRLGDFVGLSPDTYYSRIFCCVNDHCSSRRNKWIANLKLKYFNTPWAFISFFAACLLLLLTLAQTLVSVLSYYEIK